jgi:hypothetical protein
MSGPVPGCPQQPRIPAQTRITINNTVDLLSICDDLPQLGAPAQTTPLARRTHIIATDALIDCPSNHLELTLICVIFNTL